MLASTGLIRLIGSIARAQVRQHGRFMLAQRCYSYAVNAPIPCGVRYRRGRLVGAGWFHGEVACVAIGPGVDDGGSRDGTPMR